MVNKGKTHQILLIEDNPGDIRLTQEAFRESKNSINLEVVTDGIEAIHFLRKEGVYKEKLRPDLILLDLNLPKRDGREVLAMIKSDEPLKRIPIVVLTTSNAEIDVLECYNLHANCYVSKPIDFNRFFEVIHRIEEFWLSTALLPGTVTYRPPTQNFASRLLRTDDESRAYSADHQRLGLKNCYFFTNPVLLDYNRI